MNPNQTLLQGAHQSVSDVTPAPLSGPSSTVSFAFKSIIPPSELYINVDDQLIISGASSVTSEVITVNVRLLLPNGRIEDMQFQIRPGTLRTVLKQSFGLAEGFLLSMSASSSLAVTRGQTFVRVSLQRSASGASQPAYVLLADYVTTQSVPGYPNGRILSPTEGPGNVYRFQQGAPAAGAEDLVSVPTNARWRIICFDLAFTTAVAVANRTPQIIVTSQGTDCGRFPVLANIPASIAALITGTGITPYTPIVATDYAVGLPPVLMLVNNNSQAGGLATVTPGLQAADQYGLWNLLVEEWLDNV